jgi:hypothetical protein
MGRSIRQDVHASFQCYVGNGIAVRASCFEKDKAGRNNYESRNSRNLIGSWSL